MAIDKELFYASHGLKYPVVARPYTDDMEAKEKLFTKDEVIAMLTEIREKAWYRHSKYEDEKDFEVDKAVEDIVNHIDAKINALKGEENVDKTQQSSL